MENDNHDSKIDVRIIVQGLDVAQLVSKAGGVEGDAVLKGAGQLAGHNGDVALPAVDITKRHADELHVFLRDLLQNFLRRIVHAASLLSIFSFSILMQISPPRKRKFTPP